MAAGRPSKGEHATQTSGLKKDAGKEHGAGWDLSEERKMRAIRTLASGIAQDFNEVLAAIMGYVEMALLDVPKDSPARPNLKEARNAIDRAKDLVTDLLAYSRLEEQSKKPISVGETISNVIEKLRPTLPGSIELHLNIPEGLGKVNANSAQLRQIVVNLWTNASQAMLEKGGRLEIVLEETTFEAPQTASGLKPGRYLCFVVSDTGCGIAPDVSEQIFDPYFTTSDSGSGSGMGLAMVYGIVRSWGGTVQVESKPGGGSIFTVFMPVLSE